MINRVLLRWSFAAILVVATGVLEVGCKKDESPTSPGGGGGLPTFSFATSGQTFTVPASGGAARAVLTGGTLPYTITSSPNAGVATASLSYDTLTVTPVAPGSTSITITDSLGMSQDRIVTLGITVTGGTTGNLGSGTVTVNSTVGNRSYTGAGVFPIGAGPSVIAVYDTVSHVMVMLGYRQISGSHYDYALLSIFMPQGVAAGTYGGDTVGFEAGYNIDTTHTDSTSYRGVSGTITVSTVSGNNVSGTYSGQATQLVSGTTANFSGTFNVTYVRGIEPIGGGGGSTGNIPITVGSGTHPQYSWTGGGVVSLTVVRASDPGTPIWYIICSTGGDCINSPVTHGTTPTGATAIATTELTLTAGVQYRVIVVRTNNDFGSADFTP